MKYITILFFLPILSIAQSKINNLDIALHYKIQNIENFQLKQTVINNLDNTYILSSNLKNTNSDIKYICYWSRAQIMEYLTMNPRIQIT